MEVTGKIIHIGETETFGSAGTFKKRLVGEIVFMF